MKSLGKYILFIRKLFTNKEPTRIYGRLLLDECVLIGTDSVFLLSFVAIFIGAVTAFQTAYNLVSPFVPLYIIGTIVRDMTILELAPTLTAVVFAGKVGSSIAGNLGTMRITEQIDALEVMGINSASYLVLPKIIAGLIMFPLLVITSAFLSIYGGYLACILGEILTSEDYIYGIRIDFIPFNVVFALLKALVFPFLIISIASYKGYHTQGGALEVGKSSTSAITNSCIAILLADFLMAKLLV